MKINILLLQTACKGANDLTPSSRFFIRINVRDLSGRTNQISNCISFCTREMEKSKNELWRDRNKLFVAGIPSTADDDALYAKFEPFGEMFQSKVVYDNKTNRSRGFGFITYANYESCLDAIEALNNKVS